MKRNKQIDVLRLNQKRKDAQVHIMQRWWELDALHKELFRLTQEAKVQVGFCTQRLSHTLLERYIVQLDMLSLRVSRQMCKYSGWAAQLEYWINISVQAEGRIAERHFSND